MKQKISIAILVLTIVASIAIPLKASAQTSTSQGLSITPPVFELSSNPGDVVTNSIRVDNLTDGALTLNTRAENFTALGEEGQVGLSEEESAFSLASWITISPTSNTIQGRQSKVFNFTIKIPKNAEPGGRFGSIVFSTSGKKPETGSGLATSQEVASLLLLKIAGEVRERANIASFGTAHAVYERGPVTFETRIQNKGNIHVKPTGTVTITNMFGRKVASLPINSQNVLPDSIRKLTTNWAKPGSIGKYTATVSLQYGSSNETATASTTFFVIPWRMVLAWLLGLAALAFLVFLGRKRFGKALRILFGKE